MERSVRGKLGAHPAKYIVVASAACAVLTALSAWRALANDCMGPNFVYLKPGASLFDFQYYVLLFYPGPVCLLEAGILKLFLKVGYLRCLWYAVAANVVSAMIGILWMVYANEQGGWKWAIWYHEMGRLSLLLVRSFLVTVAEETVVVLLMVRNWAGAGLVFRAVAAANVVSYALSAAIMLSCR